MIDKFLLMVLPFSITLVTFVDYGWIGSILSITRYANTLMARAGAMCGWGGGDVEKTEVTIEAAARELALAGWWFGGRVEELSGAAAANCVCLKSFELRSRARAVRSAHLECAIRLQSEHSTALAQVNPCYRPRR